ncbi:hypothetical protein BH23BAC1_BH23BAC1_32750 [soil metagenome]
MGKKILKIIVFILGGIFLIAGVIYIYDSIDFSSRAKKTYEVQLRDVEILTDSASLLAGKHLSVI